MITFKCSNCGKRATVEDKYAGKKSRCPHCKNVNDIPTSSSDRAQGHSARTEDGIGHMEVICPKCRKTLYIKHDAAEKLTCPYCKINIVLWQPQFDHAAEPSASVPEKDITQGEADLNTDELAGVRTTGRPSRSSVNSKERTESPPAPVGPGQIPEGSGTQTIIAADALHKQRIALMCAAGAGMVATFLPWVKAPIVGSIAGTAGDVGWITFVLFGISLGLTFSGNRVELLSSWERTTAVISSAVAGLIGLYKIIDFYAMKSDAAGEGPLAEVLAMTVQVGIGLYLVVIAAIAFAIICFANQGEATSQRNPQMGERMQ